ncbi:uncharacterized protein LOC120543332 [Polypterus senegalus]|uniref:uncharacterized protein LOC120543332 n=1 Tax=Polypterus senegalus TaxID=55291 RepID=UPI00196400D9|nr:uncharacterized protein LOC120543332 [Polypterus senegalus]
MTVTQQKGSISMMTTNSLRGIAGRIEKIRDDIESYLGIFERTATWNQWQQTEWASILAPYLKGPAQRAYYDLPKEEAANYDLLKVEILGRYDIRTSTRIMLACLAVAAFTEKTVLQRQCHHLSLIADAWACCDLSFKLLLAMSNKTAFHSWKFRKHFRYVAEKGINLTVQCNACLPAIKMLSTSKTSMSNLRKHLERRHPSILLTQDTPCQSDDLPSTSTQESSQPPMKQARIVTGTRFSVSQECVNKLVFDFVVEDVQCFSVVEQPSFRKLVEGLSGGKKTMCRKTLMQRIDREFAIMKESVISKLIDVDTVCTTADIWSAQNRSFFGVTCHWIDKDTLERHSAALACTRLKGRHTYEAVATKLNKIHAEYKIQTKVRCTVTDNGSNFVKAFHEFGVSEEETDDHSDGVTFSDVSGLLQEEEDEQFFLPQHQRCAAHTLNLIATNEVHKAGENGPSRKLYEVQWQSAHLSGTNHIDLHWLLRQFRI